MKKEREKIKSKEESNIKNDFMYYPELTEDDFEKKIFLKKEFNDYMVKKDKKSMEELCQPQKFELFNQQKFLRNFISTETPYNGILLFHGVGVGKSCTSISIAEGFKNILKLYKKKILIISSKDISENFKKTIYDIDKEDVKERKDDIVQCTGNTYMLGDEDRHLTLEQKKRKIKREISQHYQFISYLAFANLVKRKSGWDGRMKDLTEDKIRLIRKEYSNRVIIIDEIHNIKSKKALGINKDKILEEVIKIGDNNKLILMSATPMFDKPEEIVYILNLLLLNDKRETINKSEIFTTDGNLKPNGEDILKEYSKGYISYIRGEDPRTYPLRIYPKIAEIPKIKFDINGRKLNDNDKIEFIKIIDCPMSMNQYDYYKLNLNKEIKNNNDNNDNNNIEKNSSKEINNQNIENDEKNEDDEDDEKTSGEAKLIQICNMVFPTKDGELTYGKRGFNAKEGKEGAFYISSKQTQKKLTIRFKYEKHSIFNYGKKNEVPFLDIGYIGDYSSKIEEIINIILKSKGPIIIYSRYIWGGLLPLALALEQNGVQRYLFSGEQSLLEYSPNKLGGGGLGEPRDYYDGTKFSNYKDKSRPFKVAKYALVIKRGIDSDLVRTSPQRVAEIINRSSNADGNELKIILGTNVISEGIDFKGIRQIHIMEPWYNLSKNEQIIGRGVRNCSHVKLPPEERNVEIYQYTATIPNKIKEKDTKESKMETIDLKNYRLAEMKDRKIKRIERILKENSIDCNLFKELNNPTVNKKIKLKTASGLKIKKKIGFEPYSRQCEYMKDCNYSCSYKIGDRYKINKDTYSIEFAKDEINKTKKIIKNIYKRNFSYQINNIIDEIRKEIPNIEDIYIFKGIDDMIKNKEILYDIYDREGYLIYRGDYYIFQPKDLIIENMPMYYREHPKDFYKRKISVLDHIRENKNDLENNNKINTIDNINNKIIDEIKFIKKNYSEFIEEYIPKKYQDFIIFSYLLDRINSKNILNILKSLLIEKIENIEMYKEYFKDILIIDKDIKGFLYEEKEYCLTEGIVKLCTEKYKNKLLNKLKEIRDKREYNEVYGYVSPDKKFKILDYRKSTKALTKKQKLSKRSEITGRVCGTILIDGLVDLYKILNIKLDNEKKKTKICTIIELMMRYKNITDKVKWFKNNF